MSTYDAIMVQEEKTEEWIPVIPHKRSTAKRTHDLVSARQRVAAHSIQQLIRARIERKLNQDVADQLCHFPRHTFREMECHRLIPSVYQMSVIQRVFGVTVRILSIPLPPAVQVPRQTELHTELQSELPSKEIESQGTK